MLPALGMESKGDGWRRGGGISRKSGGVSDLEKAGRAVQKVWVTVIIRVIMGAGKAAAGGFGFRFGAGGAWRRRLQSVRQ